MENPVMKRILEEYDKIESNPSDDFMFRKLDWDSYEWQGALRGPSGTEFEGGIYHVLLQFPIEYPWKEPAFIFLTENGSFSIETKTNARLNWDPSRRLRQAFLQLIDLMPDCPDFESDSIEHKEKRRDLARKSRAAAREYGNGERRKLINKIHQHMLRDVPQLQQTRNTSLTQRCEEEVVLDRVRSTQMESDRSVIVEDKCNIKNSLEKRILEEYNEIESNPSYDFTCLTQSWNKYEWQYAIRGPCETEFEDGIYHGMVQFSVGYPSMPPSIVFLTENGCFKIQTSASLKRLPYWQPSCSVRNFLVAVIEEMPSYSNGDLVPVENNREARRRLAINSRAEAPKYGSVERQKLIAEIHEHLLIKTSVPELSPVTSQASNGTGGGLVFNINFIFRDAFNVIFGNTLKSICGNAFGGSNADNVGVSNSMNEAPNPMIRILFSVLMFFFIILFGFWSYKK
ncbi:unnamed protein product [Prunus armeniaca]|uniref:UBC core domain-containing protein n=1 Tax=Prunus armeniaca TaxID=36596 RepID=A0A6J5VIF7_PRUAR|nr:unnamed protein product [Prunus armeniaca]